MQSSVGPFRQLGQILKEGPALFKALMWLGAVVGLPACLFLGVLIFAPDQPDLLWKAPAGFGLATLALMTFITARHSLLQGLRRLSVWLIFVGGGLAVLYLALLLDITLEGDELYVVYGLFGLLFVALVSLYGWAQQSGAKAGQSGLVKSVTPEDRQQAVILAREIRMLALLTYGEVVDFEHIEKRGPQEKWWSGLFGEEIHMNVVVKAAVGVNLARLTDDMIRLNERTRTAHITLPPARLLVNYIDEQATRVKAYKLGLFAAIDPNLHHQARKRAMDRYVNDIADVDRLFRDANRSAAAFVEDFLHAKGFRNITVETQLPAPGHYVEDLHQLPRSTPYNPQQLPGNEDS